MRNWIETYIDDSVLGSYNAGIVDAIEMFLYQIQAVRIAAFVTEPSDLDMQTFTDKDIEWVVERVTAEHWEIPEMEAALEKIG